MSQVTYRRIDNYKYLVHDLYTRKIPITGHNAEVLSPEGHILIKLTADGLLSIFPGYAWDGASGPTKDDNTNIRGSLEHDALYQILRAGLLPPKYRKDADNIMLDCLARDGMNVVRRGLWYAALRVGAAGAAAKQKEKSFAVYSAP